MADADARDGIAHASGAEAPAAAAWGGRLLRLRLIEDSVLRAKQALGLAEDTMRSVHAGLALEPLAQSKPACEQAVAATEAAAEPPSRIFDPYVHYRRLQLSQVPEWAQAAVLVLIGWCVAFALPSVIGRNATQEFAAAVKAPFTAIMGGRDNPGTAKGAMPPAEEPESRLASGEAPVIIYERSSPYPRLFGALGDKDRFCLAEAIYYEARGEPAAGQIAVAQVVLNRTFAGPWPKKVCEVTHQGAENGEKCQFSYACMRRFLTKPHGDAWDSAQGLAEEILAGGAWLEEMLDATHFHRWDLKPVWRLNLVEVGRFGRHIFYNSPTENRRPLSRQAAR